MKKSERQKTVIDTSNFLWYTKLRTQAHSCLEYYRKFYAW